MTMELDLNHPPTTDSNSLELWRFHALFDQPIKGNTDGGQPQKSPAEQRALQEKSATLLHEVQDYFHADRTNTYIALSTPFAAAGARALLGTTAGWCVAGAMFGWNLYNHFKLNHELTKINSDLTPDIRQNYKALSQAADLSLNSRSTLGDVTYGALATALAMTVPRNGLAVGVTTLGVGLAGYKKYWSAETDSLSRAQHEAVNAIVSRLGVLSGYENNCPVGVGLDLRLRIRMLLIVWIGLRRPGKRRRRE